LESLWK